MNNARHLRQEITYKKDGIMEKRANEVLAKATSMLERVAEINLMSAIEDGMFASIKRERTGGRGLDGVIKKSKRYYNPFPRLFMQELESPHFSPVLWGNRVKEQGGGSR